MRDYIDLQKRCCENCFNSFFVKKSIQENSEAKGSCDYCGKKDTNLINPEKLYNSFNPIVSLYEPIHEMIHEVYMPPGYYMKTISEKIVENWDIFSDDFPTDKMNDFLLRVFGPYSPETGEGIDINVPVEDSFAFFGVDEAPSEMLQEKWDSFCTELISENRFFLKKESSIEILSDVKILSKTIGIGEYLYRSRRSKGTKKIPPRKMGMPPRDKSQPGRANPKGIPYLYLANDYKTAAYEIRPSIEENITIGTFKVISELSLVDLSKPRISDPFLCGENLRQTIGLISFLKMLGYELRKPIASHNKELGYLPTQYLCEFLKHQGYDGVVYKSNLGPGNNIVLFKESKVKCTRSNLYSIDDLNLIKFDNYQIKK